MLPLNEIPLGGAKVACYDDLPCHEQQQFMSMVWLHVPVMRAAGTRNEKRKIRQDDLVSQWCDLVKNCYFWWYR